MNTQGSLISFIAQRRHTRVGAVVPLVLFLSILLGIGIANGQTNHVAGVGYVASTPPPLQEPPVNDGNSIEDLLTARLQQEWARYGRDLKPVALKAEADYIRTSAVNPEVVLYEGNFHLEPHYYTISPTGADTTTRDKRSEQPIMYYTGSARTPLALPVVTDAAKKLNPDEASYTVNIGILPLPQPANSTSDSIHYYVILERTVESNHTDNSVRLERFAKEFAALPNEPVPLRLENAPPANNAYIQLENGTVFDFYEDFARYFTEHILINGERLHFALGTQHIATITSKLTIPYSIAQTSDVSLKLLSVVDTAHAMDIVDTLRQPADYLAELDISHLADGPYRYELTATDPKSDAVLFSETHDFQKVAPLYVESSSRVASGDTLRVGGKQTNWKAYAAELNSKLTMERVINDRLNSTLDKTSTEKQALQDIVSAHKQSSISDIHGRAGFGMGLGAGDNVLIGIEASHPAVSLDLSFGYLYSAVPYLNYSAPANFSKITSSPKSVGVQLSYRPIDFFDHLIEPMVGVAFYGVWSASSGDFGGPGSASLLAPSIGIASEPFGELNGLGLSFAYEPVIGLGLSPASIGGVSFKAYVRF